VSIASLIIHNPKAKLAMKTIPQFAIALVPVAFSLFLTSLLILLVGNNPFEVASLVINGALGNPTSVANLLNFWIPLVLCAIGLIVTFRAGLYNINVEGQMMAGAIGSSFVALYVPNLPTLVLIPLAILVAMLAGMATGVVVGVLKTRLGINEIFGGVAVNALINLYSIYLISGPWQPAEGGSAQSTPQFPQEAWLLPFSNEFPLNLSLFIVAIVAIFGVAYVLNGTKWGLQLKATGKNPRSALLLGVPVERSTLSALLVCGALAGIAGAHRTLFIYQSLRPLVSGGIGFLALLVVLLASVRVLWVTVISLAFAAILAGSTRLKIALQLDQSLAGVLQGLIVLSVLLFNGYRQQWEERNRSGEKGKG
jgi:simple sugar transport system permease protein